MPKHRSRCVACGCARICCVENFVFLWVVLFILIQAGPLSVLVWDFLNVNSHGIAISRWVWTLTLEFFLNVFTELDRKIYVIKRNQDATTVPARHMWEKGSLNWAQFTLQWFIIFPEFTEFTKFLIHLGKTPMSADYSHLIFFTLPLKAYDNFCWNSIFKLT